MDETEGKLTGDEAAKPEPLRPSLMQRLWQLIGKADRTPEEHAELTDLHARATAYVEAWRADPEAALGHLVVALDGISKTLGHIAAVVPAAAGIAGTVRMIDAAVDRMRDAVVPPSPPPELPPAPEAPQPDHTSSEPLPMAADATREPPGPQHDHGDPATAY